MTVYFRQIRPLKKVGVDYEALGTKTSTTYKQVQQTEQFNEKLLFKQSVRTARRIRGPMFQYWQELFISIVMSTRQSIVVMIVTVRANQVQSQTDQELPMPLKPSCRA